MRDALSRAACGVAAFCLPALALGQAAAAKREPALHGATGSVVQYEEVKGGAIVYQEEKGGMLTTIAPPAIATRGDASDGPAPARPGVATKASPQLAQGAASGKTVQRRVLPAEDTPIKR